MKHYQHDPSFKLGSASYRDNKFQFSVISSLAKHLSTSLWLAERNPNEVGHQLHSDTVQFVVTLIADDLGISAEVIAETNKLLDLRRSALEAK